MARGGKKEGSAAAEPEAEERSRLKKLAFSKSILSQTQPKVGGSSAALAPSKTLIKHHGKDILRKSQRKNKYLFSFPGLLGPVSGGKIGELKDLGSKNPILYLDFPQGQMKLFGTIVYPKNRYLTLQFSRGGKNVTCDDDFDNMIVFSEAWWIGTKEQNPEELELEFPKELNKDEHAEYDFKGGVGVTCDSKPGSGKFAMKREPPKVYMEDDSTDSPIEDKELAEVTPIRQSARTSGKAFKFAESSSGDDLFDNEGDTPEEEDEKVDNETRTYTSNRKFTTSRPLVFDVDDDDNARQDPASEQHKHIEKATDSSDNGHKSLVQTTLSSLFKKVEEKKVKKDAKKKTTTSEASKRMKGGKKIERGKSGTVTKEQKKQPEVLYIQEQGRISGSFVKVEEDDIEEFSSASQDMDASDEDWNS